MPVDERRLACHTRPRDRFCAAAQADLSRPVSHFFTREESNASQKTSRIAEWEELGDGRTTREELDLLRLEQHTWGLLQAVMP